MKLYDGDFPVLATDRLLLRKPVLQDAKALFSLRTDALVNKYIDREPPRAEEDVISFIEKVTAAVDAQESMYWVIDHENTVVGTICLWNFNPDRKVCEIGFELTPALHGKGLISEALTRVMMFVQTFLKIEKMEAYTHKENMASIKLLLKAGLVANELRHDDENKDMVIFFLAMN